MVKFKYGKKVVSIYLYMYWIRQFFAPADKHLHCIVMNSLDTADFFFFVYYNNLTESVILVG